MRGGGAGDDGKVCLGGEGVGTADECCDAVAAGEGFGDDEGACAAVGAEEEDAHGCGVWSIEKPGYV